MRSQPGFNTDDVRIQSSIVRLRRLSRVPDAKGRSTYEMCGTRAMSDNGKLRPNVLKARCTLVNPMDTSSSIRHRFDVEIPREKFVEMTQILKGESTWKL